VFEPPIVALPDVPGVVPPVAVPPEIPGVVPPAVPVFVPSEPAPSAPDSMLPPFAEKVPDSEQAIHEPVYTAQPLTHESHDETHTPRAAQASASISLDGVLAHLHHSGSIAIAMTPLAITAGHDNHDTPHHDPDEHRPNGAHFPTHHAHRPLAYSHSPTHAGATGITTSEVHDTPEQVMPKHDDVPEHRTQRQHITHAPPSDLLAWEHVPNFVEQPGEETPTAMMEVSDALVLSAEAEPVTAFYTHDVNTEARMPHALPWMAISLLLLWCGWSVQQPTPQRPSRYLAIR
jgi:hypothetical protein